MTTLPVADLEDQLIHRWSRLTEDDGHPSTRQVMDGFVLRRGHSEEFRVTAITEAEDVSIQLSMLPEPDAVKPLIENTELDDLREFAIALTNLLIDVIRNLNVDIRVITLLNGWIASLEETIAAGDDLDEILSRRRTHKGYNALA